MNNLHIISINSVRHIPVGSFITWAQIQLSCMMV